MTPITLRPLGDSLSFTQISQLAPGYKFRCPRKWAYSYRLGLPFVTSPAIEMGSAIDEAANWFFQERMNGREYLEVVNEAIERAVAYWKSAIIKESSNIEFARVGDKHTDKIALGAVEFFQHHSEVIPLAVQTRHEIRFKTLSGNVSVYMGYSDRIDAPSTIVDHKVTGSAKWDGSGNWDMGWVLEKKDQLLGYWLDLCRQARSEGREDPPGRGKLVILNLDLRLKNVVIRELDLEFDATERDALLERIRIAQKIKESGVYPAVPGNACGFCSHRERCQQDEAERAQPFTAMTGVPDAA